MKENNKQYISISLVEVILAMTLFTFVVMGIVGVIASVMQDSSRSVYRVKAFFLVDEGFEMLKDFQDFDSPSYLNNGTYAFKFDGIQWDLVLDGEEIIDDLYRKVVIDDGVNVHLKEVTIIVGRKNDKEIFSNKRIFILE